MPDEPRSYKSVCEPIAMQIRRVGQGDVKLIWWFVAAANEGEPVGQYEMEFHSYDKALQILTFEDDRELVKKAIDLVNSSINL